jgi:DUF4097 and DUF4098 domain-containing protein YvlB
MSYRRLIVLGVLSVLALAPRAAASKVSAEIFEATLEETFSAPVDGKVTFENLLGTIQVRPQPQGRDVRITALVAAESSEKVEARDLAQAVRLVREEVDGGVHWRVAFPDQRLFRMPKTGVASVYSKWLAPLVKRKTVSARYDGRAVEIGSARGATAISVTLEVEVPMDLRLTAIQHVGTIDCQGVRGDVSLEVKQGEIEAGRVFGALRVTTEGASARVWGFNGERLDVETGSGTIELQEIRSTSLRIDSARGVVHGTEIEATDLSASTGSGKIELAGVESESMNVTSDTGDLDLATELKKAREASIRSITGNVTMRLGTFASFQLEANSPNGAVKGSGVNVAVDQFEKNQATLARGSGGPKLSVESESGQILIRPL